MEATTHEANLSLATVTQSEPLPVSEKSPVKGYGHRFRAMVTGLLVGLSSIGGTVEAGDPTATPAQGSLVIAGGGILPPEIRQRFIELGGGKDARVVLIPTASADADIPDKEESFYWPGLRENVTSVKIFHTRDRKVADDEVATEPLDTATAVWFTGGKQELITATYLKTKTQEKIYRILQRGGVVGGTSAGAAIMSRPMIEGGKNEPIMSEGLGFAAGWIVDQHFLKRNREDRLKAAMKLFPDFIGMGVDEGTAAVVGNDLQVIGNSVVSVYERNGNVRRLNAGESLDLRPMGVHITTASDTTKPLTLTP